MVRDAGIYCLLVSEEGWNWTAYGSMQEVKG